MHNIICIAGPTASGKTELAVKLAKTINGEVISCDSMQIYKRMDIGTAKPTLDEMQDVPHHMLSIVEPWEEYSVSRYCEAATAVLEDILSRGKTAIIAGGTGLYMDALIRGNSFAPYPSTGRRQELEKIAKEEGIGKILEMLKSVDPESAERLHPSDQKRIIRAMEVYLETGISITEHNRRTQLIPPKFSACWFALQDENRAELYSRIDKRVVKMLEMGLIDEIRELLRDGLSKKSTALQAIGYKEFIAYLEGAISLEEATAGVQQASRHYAKRQLTWFRKNPQIHWLTRKNGEQTDEILQKLRQILGDYDN